MPGPAPGRESKLCLQSQSLGLPDPSTTLSPMRPFSLPGAHTCSEVYQKQREQGADQGDGPGADWRCWLGRQRGTGGEEENDM